MPVVVYAVDAVLNVPMVGVVNVVLVGVVAVEADVLVVVYGVDAVLNVPMVGVVNGVLVGVVSVEADAVVPVVVTGVLGPTVDSDTAMTVAGVVVLCVMCDISVKGRLRHTFRSLPPFRRDRNPNDKF